MKRNTMGAALCLCVLPLMAAGKPAGPEASRQASEESEYQRLTQEIALFAPDTPQRKRLEAETFRSQALIQPADRSPVTVLLRRTAALLEHLAGRPGAPDLKAFGATLAALAARDKPELNAAQRRELFGEIAALRRQIAFANPLLDFDRLLFLTRQKQARGERHMIDQFLGFNAGSGGGIYVLEKPFGPSPTARNLLADSPVIAGKLKDQKLTGGSFLSLDLNYDAQTIAFAWTQANAKVPTDADWSKQPWSEAECRSRGPNYQHYHWRDDNCFHLFTAKIDGTGLQQLSDGMYNEYDPCFLPSGRLMYVSERAWSNQRCGVRWCGTTNLFSMNPDGSDTQRLSYHETSEWLPSVAHDGQVLFTRWDYTDRDDCGAHHLWVCRPDGTNPRAPHGNYTDKGIYHRPDMEVNYRAIPGSHRLIAVAAAHHGENFGSLILVDPEVPDDRAMSQVRRLTPEVLFPEAEMEPGRPRDHDATPQDIATPPPEKFWPRSEFGQPWPLSEDFWLVSYRSGSQRNGLYLADSFGNRILLFEDPQVPIWDSMVLRPRAKPPVIPAYTPATPASAAAAKTDATVSVMDVYQSQHPWPEGTKISAIRIVNVFPKDTAMMNVPNIGPHQSIARGSLGTVPVEADGSAYFRVPSGIEFYLQVLDEKGRALQSMRSGTYAHAGEHLSCIGCHENPSSAAVSSRSHGTPIAMGRAPSDPTPEPIGSWPLSFPRLVQPVLDAKCLECHNQNPRSPDLRGEFAGKVRVNSQSANDIWNHAVGLEHESNGWSKSYMSLRNFNWHWDGGNAGRRYANYQIQYSIPGEIGARKSKLLALLEKGHHGVSLTEQEWRRLTLWMDLNSNFYGDYHEPEKQTAGALVVPKSGVPQDWQRWVR